MKIFEIELEEVYHRSVKISAPDYEAALVKARRVFELERMTLESGDLLKRKIRAVSTTDRKDALMKEILEYIYDEEERHFEECCEEESEDHIFLKIKELHWLISKS